jgi:hypothetical protein
MSPTQNSDQRIMTPNNDENIDKHWPMTDKYCPDYTDDMMIDIDDRGVSDVDTLLATQSEIDREEYEETEQNYAQHLFSSEAYDEDVHAREAENLVENQTEEGQHVMGGLSVLASASSRASEPLVVENRIQPMVAEGKGKDWDADEMEMLLKIEDDMDRETQEMEQGEHKQLFCTFAVYNHGFRYQGTRKNLPAPSIAELIRAEAVSERDKKVDLMQFSAFYEGVSTVSDVSGLPNGTPMMGYAGVFDIDMTDAKDKDGVVHTAKDAKAEVCRLIHNGASLTEVTEQVLPFKNALEGADLIVAAISESDAKIWFTGGKGFRVVFYNPESYY